MIYKGIFKDTLQRDVQVIIDTNDGDPNIVEFNELSSDIKFTKKPVTITSETDDMFQTTEIASADINLLVSTYLGGELFAINERYIRVNIIRGNDVLFAGFLEPEVYNQPYSKSWNQLGLTAYDGLSTLEYRNYLDIQTKDDYGLHKAEIDTVTIGTIFEKMLESVRNLDIIGGSHSNIFYDGSVRIDASAAVDSIFDISLYEALFFGEEFDDLKTYDELAEDILKYLNLHIKQVGFDYYIYHHASIGHDITWYPVLGSTGDATTPVYETGAYILVKDSYMIYGGDYRQKLRHTLTKEEIPGNVLPLRLGRTIEYVSGEYRRYYYAELPNLTTVRTDKYNVVSITDDLDFIDKDGIQKVLLQDPYGNYDLLGLDNPPEDAYESGQFVKSAYKPQDGEFIITDN